MPRYKLRTLLIVLALGPMVLVVLYVLSIGPVFALTPVRYESTVRQIYRPVLECAPQPALEKYVDWWVWLTVSV
jgi:hypothetical protein